MEPQGSHGGDGTPAPKPPPPLAAPTMPVATQPAERPGPGLSRSVERSVQLPLTVPGGMTEGAVDHFAQCVHRFALDLARETSRLEEGERANTLDDPEITTTMVVKANDAVRNPLSTSAQPTLAVAVFQLVAFSFGILAAIAGAYLHSWQQWLLTSFFALIAVSAEVFSIFTLRRR